MYFSSLRNSFENILSSQTSFSDYFVLQPFYNKFNNDSATHTDQIKSALLLTLTQPADALVSLALSVYNFFLAFTISPLFNTKDSYEALLRSKELAIHSASTLYKAPFLIFNLLIAQERSNRIVSLEAMLKAWENQEAYFGELLSSDDVLSQLPDLVQASQTFAKGSAQMSPKSLREHRLEIYKRVHPMDSPTGYALRKVLAPILYKPPQIIASHDRRVSLKPEWLSEKQIYEQVHAMAAAQSEAHREAFLLYGEAISRCHFFHGTRKASFDPICKSREIQVKHESLYEGAFASTQPELRYGPYYFGLSSDLERATGVLQSFPEKGKNYEESNEWIRWVGFEKEIRLDSFLVCVFISESAAENQNHLSDVLFNNNFKNIPVVVLTKEVQDLIIMARNLRFRIPEEWPDDSDGRSRGFNNAFVS